MTKKTKPTATKPRGLSGPKKLYRHVGTTPVTMKLTPEGVQIMVTEQDRTGLSRGDLVEFLLRKYARKVPAGLLEKQAAAQA